MNPTVATRSRLDRIRYSISFELTLLTIIVPFGAFFFDKHLAEIGALGVFLAFKAMVVSYLYNLVFDHFDARSGVVASQRSAPKRILHAVGFETTLLITTLPFLMWFLDLTILQALLTDITVATFVVGYTYCFTLVYDRLFPVRAAA